MSERFSDLTRALAAPMPRRRALLLIAGTMAGAVLGLAPSGAGAATCSQCTCNDDGNAHYDCVDEHRRLCPNCKGCNSELDAGKVCS
jgi:hypothetical protein